MGAGPAGSSLAIRLAKSGIAVTLVERERFPRHKLCGEFISPECFRHFDEFGILTTMTSAGGERVRETSFHSQSGRSVTVPSSWLAATDALSLSRSQMDMQMLGAARRHGAEVLEGTSVSGLLRSGNGVSGIVANVDNISSQIKADIVVDATGRAGVLSVMNRRDQKNTRPHVAAKPQFVGFKAHLAETRAESGRCEIFFFKGGYGGLTRVEGGVANLCFLVDPETVRAAGGDPHEIMRSAVFQNARAKWLLQGSTPRAEWLKVAIRGFGRQELSPANGLFTVGDSAAFIDPFTGSGMLLALESAEVLANSIVETRDDPQQTAAVYQKAYSERFSSRLAAASVLRRAAFFPHFASAAIAAAATSMRATRLAARLTRRRASDAFAGR